MRKFRNGSMSGEDIDNINQQYIGNEDVSLPPISNLRYACDQNIERNAVEATLFLQHLKRTHTKSNDFDTICPEHTVIIKGDLTRKGRGPRLLLKSLQNRIYDECGDTKVRQSDNTKVDPALKFYFGVPLMMTSNKKRIKEELANGTCCYGEYIKLKKDCQFTKEN